MCKVLIEQELVLPMSVKTIKECELSKVTSRNDYITHVKGTCVICCRLWELSSLTIGNSPVKEQAMTVLQKSAVAEGCSGALRHSLQAGITVNTNTTNICKPDCFQPFKNWISPVLSTSLYALC